MEDAIRKARVLVEALGWIRQFRGRYVVIKLGGSALDDPDSVRSWLNVDRGAFKRRFRAAS